MGMLVSFLVLTVPAYLWQWSTFGWPFPNTYYAKTGGGWLQMANGVGYVMNNGLAFLFPAVAIPLVLLFMRVRRGGIPRSLGFGHAYIGVLSLVLLCVVAFNGGDNFPFGRFIVPIIPMLFVAVLGAGFVPFSSEKLGESALRSVALILSIGIALAYWKPWHAYLWQRTIPVPEADPAMLEYLPSWDTGFILSAKTLAAIAPEGAAVAAVPIGAIGYYSGLNVIDMVGLVDPVIAHEPLDLDYARTWRPGHDKGDGAYILGRQPDYIQLVDLLTSQPMPIPDAQALQYKSVVEIWDSPDFHTDYEFRAYQTEGGWYVNYYERTAR